MLKYPNCYNKNLWEAFCLVNNWCWPGAYQINTIVVHIHIWLMPSAPSDRNHFVLSLLVHAHITDKIYHKQSAKRENIKPRNNWDDNDIKMIVMTFRWLCDRSRKTLCTRRLKFFDQLLMVVFTAHRPW